MGLDFIVIESHVIRLFNVRFVMFRHGIKISSDISKIIECRVRDIVPYKTPIIDMIC